MTNAFNLLPHNEKALTKIEDAIADGEKTLAILHATGTGKSYISLEFIHRHPDKKILFLTRYNSIIEHLKEIISENQNINVPEYLKNLTFMTYNSLVNMTKEELKNLDIDVMITDEFHHIGAPVWENRINTIIETHENLITIGTSAYSIRNRKTPYERDMAEPNGNEIFSDKIYSIYTLVDAILDGNLPLPRYKTAIIVLDEFLNSIERKLKLKPHTEEYNHYIETLNNIRKKISSLSNMDDLIKKNINIGDKFIYFCPPSSDNEETNIDTIMADTYNKLISLGYKKEDIIFYKSTSNDPLHSKSNRDAFYNDLDLENHDVSKKLRIMFAINQYNEGVHVPNITGVILGRGTKSDIVFFEQIGRALCIRENYQELISKYQEKSYEELLSICKNMDIKTNDNMTKDDLIERIISPIIIDLAGNFTFIRDLITTIRNKIKESSYSKNPKDKKNLDITEESFDIEVIGEDIFEILEGLNESFKPRNFNDIYILATNFKNYYGHLNIPRNFKTEDGIHYDEFGYSLGEWLAHIRYLKKTNQLTQEIIDKMESLNIVWRVTKTFKEALEDAKVYYDEHHNLDIPYNYKTKDGYSLGTWLVNVRRKKRLGLLSEEHIKYLESLHIKWQLIKTFEDSYKLLKEYYNYNKNIDLPPNFTTNDGINYDPEGFNLSAWLQNQITAYHNSRLSEEKIKLLENLNINWKEKKDKVEKLTWDEYYNLAKNYYNFYHNLLIKRDFKTVDGITPDELGYSLGRWISRQQVNKQKGKLTETQIILLDSIGMCWQRETPHKTFEESYQIAVNYYLTHGNLFVPTDYRTEDNYNLSSFLYQIRKKRENNELTEEQIYKLDLIGMIWNPTKNYNLIKEVLKSYGINPRKHSSKLRSLSLLELEAKITIIKELNQELIISGELNPIFNMSTTAIEELYNKSVTDIIKVSIKTRRN